MKAAAAAVTELKDFDFAKIEEGDVGKAFVAAEGKIKECFEQFQVSISSNYLSLGD